MATARTRRKSSPDAPLGRSDIDQIIVHGARENNLDIDLLRIPREAIVCVTGVSGSGKSSLCFATLYAEGQRRYLESLSSYARQFLQMMEKPDVDSIEGLSPAISIDQKTTSKNPRSTVATVTELYDYFRLLWARVGHPHCPVCGRPIAGQSVEQIADRIMGFAPGTQFTLMAPVVRQRKGEFRDLFVELAEEGFSRVRVNGDIRRLDETITLDKKFKHDVDVVIDRLTLREDLRSRITEGVELATELAEGLVSIVDADGNEHLYSQAFACPEHGVGVEEMEPRIFSFNAPHGACERCHGLGFLQTIDADLLVNPALSLSEGAFAAGKTSNSTYFEQMLMAAARRAGIDEMTPWRELSKRDRDYLLYGHKRPEKVTVSYRNFMGRNRQRQFDFIGAVPELQGRYDRRVADKESHESDYVMRKLEEIMSLSPCPSCAGARLRPEVLAVTVGGLSIYEATRLSVADAREFFHALVLSDVEYEIGRRVLKEIRERLSFLDDVGLGYLTLDRAATTLSGGEARRIQLSSSLAQALRGLTAILDEPSVGLHQRDNERLIATLEHLRDQGNTVIVVEHDEQTQLAADWLIDMGPGAGEYGGRVISQGRPKEVCRDPESLTGLYLSGKRHIPIPERRSEDRGWLEVFSASEHTLKSIDVAFPLQKFVCVTGVSGSGKSTLVNEVLYKAVVAGLDQAKAKPGKHRELRGLADVERVIDIDQSPIGRTPRSNPATYTKVFDEIRSVFAMTKEARARGYKPGRFSFNVSGGRCEVCKGDGYITKEMHFLPDIQVRCDVCDGKRFNKETLAIHYKGKSIADVLAMSVDEAADFFQNIPKIARKLNTLRDVGLGYIRLGQPATTLSGGEAQRVKLSTHLSKSVHLNRGKLLILDEPTTGLSTADIHELLRTLHRMVDAGVSIICIEHNLDVIKTADWIVDLGPEGGVDGGEVVCVGTPEQVAEHENSWTGRFLKDTLQSTRQNMARHGRAAA